MDRETFESGVKAAHRIDEGIVRAASVVGCFLRTGDAAWAQAKPFIGDLHPKGMWVSIRGMSVNGKRFDTNCIIEYNEGGAEVMQDGGEGKDGRRRLKTVLTLPYEQLHPQLKSEPIWEHARRRNAPQYHGTLARPCFPDAMVWKWEAISAEALLTILPHIDKEARRIPCLG